MNIKIIGLGGIGTWLINPFLLFLSSHDPAATVTFIDGDEYEEKNRSRQKFHRLGNKAEVTAERATAQFRTFVFDAMPHYIWHDNIPGFIYNGDVVFLCVDNHPTRRVMSEYAVSLPDITVISGGNTLTEGIVQVHVRKDNQNLTLPLANEFHQDIVHAPIHLPHRAGCMEMVQSEPQLVPTNNTASTLMLNTFYACLQGTPDYDEILFDIVFGNCRAVRLRA